MNKIAEEGYRLVRTGKMLYEFEECEPSQIQYQVEFVGDKSKDNTQVYYEFLEDMGYKLFYKNVNLNFSLRKLRWRPWAQKGGHIATKATNLNRELLIIEKENGGTAFEKENKKFLKNF